MKPISDPIVLHETPNWIAIGKPAGLVIEKSPYEPSLESWVMHYLSLHHKSPFVGVIHRLDRMTTGIILFAKKKQALKKFNSAFAQRQIKKQYLCLLASCPSSKQGQLQHWLKKNQGEFKTSISPQPQPGYQACKLSYEVIGGEEFGGYLVQVTPETGRYHQIRAQFSAMGYPLLGDTIYGSKVVISDQRIALHAHRLEFQDPDTQQSFNLICPLPDDDFWQSAKLFI